MAEGLPNKALLLWLHRVSKAPNLGHALRIADAAGCGLILSATPLSPQQREVALTAQGTQDKVEVASFDTFEEALAALRAAGYRIFGTSPRGAHYYAACSLLGHVALLFGHESQGLSEDELAGCDDVLTIPIYGAVESLNLASAIAVLTYEGIRQRIAEGVLPFHATEKFNRNARPKTLPSQ